MKRVIIFLTMMLSLVMITSCNKNKNIINSDPPAEPAYFLIEVTGEDVYENGYYCERLTNGTTVHFWLNSASEEPAGWYIYLVDNELSDEEIIKLKETAPALIGSGDIESNYGQWIYIFCDVNKETADEPTKDVLSFSYPASFI